MSRTTVSTANAPSAIGTYSQAVNVNGTVYLSGQIPLDPTTMEIVDGTREQVDRVFATCVPLRRRPAGTFPRS